MVLVEAGEIAGGGGDLHEVGRVPGPAERDRGLLEDEVDVDGQVRLSRPALLELLDEPHDRRVLLGELGLVGEVGRGDRHERKRTCGHEGEDDGSHAVEFDAEPRFPGFRIILSRLPDHHGEDRARAGHALRLHTRPLRRKRP